MYGFTVMLSMLVLRLIVPLVITAILAWALRRLDARWQREAQRPRPVR
jgi:hypothetical protein